MAADVPRVALFVLKKSWDLFVCACMHSRITFVNCGMPCNSVLLLFMMTPAFWTVFIDHECFFTNMHDVHECAIVGLVCFVCACVCVCVCPSSPCTCECLCVCVSMHDFCTCECLYA